MRGNSLGACKRRWRTICIVLEVLVAISSLQTLADALRMSIILPKSRLFAHHVILTFMLFSLLLRCVLLAVGGAFFMLLFMVVVWLVMDEIVSCMSKDIFSAFPSRTG